MCQNGLAAATGGYSGSHYQKVPLCLVDNAALLGLPLTTAQSSDCWQEKNVRWPALTWDGSCSHFFLFTLHYITLHYIKPRSVKGTLSGSPKMCSRDEPNLIFALWFDLESNEELFSP